MPAKRRGPGRPPKRTGEARPRTCRYCEEKHYASIMCEPKRLVMFPPAPEPEPEPVVMTMPPLSRVGLWAGQERQAGSLKPWGSAPQPFVSILLPEKEGAL